MITLLKVVKRRTPHLVLGLVFWNVAGIYYPDLIPSIASMIVDAMNMMLEPLGVYLIQGRSPGLVGVIITLVIVDVLCGVLIFLAWQPDDALD